MGGRELVGLFPPTVPVQSHHILEAGLGAEVSHNLVDDISIVRFSTMFMGVDIRSCYRFCGVFWFCGFDFIAMEPRPWS